MHSQRMKHEAWKVSGRKHQETRERGFRPSLVTLGGSAGWLMERCQAAEECGSVLCKGGEVIATSSWTTSVGRPIAPMAWPSLPKPCVETSTCACGSSRERDGGGLAPAEDAFLAYFRRYMARYSLAERLGIW